MTTTPGKGERGADTEMGYDVAIRTAQPEPEGISVRIFRGGTITRLWPDDPAKGCYRAQRGGYAVTRPTWRQALYDLREWERRRGHRWWARGRFYRVVMRVGHRLGWCFPSETIGSSVKCQWCGLQGRR